MNKKLVFIALGAAAFAATAYAGRISTGPVGVSGSFGYGNLGDARASADDQQMIGCNTFGWAQTTGPGYVFCWAVTAEGKQLACSKQDNASFVNAASAVGPASYISFGVDKEGYCDSLDVQNFSAYTPMVP
jgi:hypothetical protein